MRYQFDQFIAVGQRWDLGISEALTFENGWEEELDKRAREEGSLHPACGIDYFAFTRGAIPDMPDFLVGSPGWDNWTVQNALRRNVPVVDVTKGVTCIHHDHKKCWPAEGTKHNRNLAGGDGHGGFISDSSWLYLAKGRIVER